MADLLSFDIGLNLDRKPAVSFNFVLRVEALYDLPCKSVRTFSKANEYEYVQEGGVNDYVHMLRKPISQPFTFQVERYVGVNLLDPLTNGTDLVLPVILMVNRTYGDSQTVRYYIFTGCTVTAKEFGALDSEKSGLLTEITTIAYQEMFCIDNPLAGILKDSWSFDGTSKKGSGTRSARHIDDAVKGSVEPDQASMQARAKKWMFTAGDTARALQNETTTGGRKGTVLNTDTDETAAQEMAKLAFLGINQSANTLSEARKDAMEENAKKWPRTQSAVSPTGQLSQQEMEEKALKWPDAQSAVSVSGQLSQQEMEEKARQWPPTQSAAAVSGQLSQEEMEQKALRWPPTQSAVSVSGQLSQEEMEQKALRWPPTRSAASVSGQLSQQEMEQKARLWPSTKSAVNIVSYLEQNYGTGGDTTT